MADEQPRTCPPCRGTGTVISNLGGTPSQVTCPWCGGSGVLQPGQNAQERSSSGGPPADN